eukprot:scpid74979/ scgid15011/ Uncharacterized protein C2orf61 homolog
MSVDGSASEFGIAAPPQRRAMSAFPATGAYMPTDPMDVSKFSRRQRTFSARVSSNRPSVRVEARTYSAMKAAGPDKWMNYDRPKTGREGWWRRDVVDTPKPGAYNLPDFLVDIDKKPSTYRFSAPERECQLADPGKSGELLDPYRYDHKSFLAETNAKKLTYGFKVTERDQAPKIGDGFGDKHLANLDPTMYRTVNFLPEARAERTNSAFKSKYKRHSSGPFVPKVGPSPATRDLSLPLGGSGARHSGTSSFMSGVSRLPSRHTAVPGPGHYTPSDPRPMPPSILAPKRARSKSAPASRLGTSAKKSTNSKIEELDDEEDEDESK